MKYAPSKYPIISKLPVGYNSPKVQMGNTIGLTRNAVAINPLTGYNVSTGNVMTQFLNDVQAKHGSYGYVGGDTTELTFDFGTKVAGSVVECPMKLYRSRMTALQTPANITGNIDTGFQEYDSSNQPVFDAIKTQDGNSYAPTALGTGYIMQFMIELDLTSVVNQLFGGSTNALKSALKGTGLKVDIYAIGYGSNVGVITNGCTVKWWYSDGNAWFDRGSNTTSSIAKITDTRGESGYISSSNKMYILVHSNYHSDGNISSNVSLDYAKITIGLNRTVDTVTPKPVYLPKYFAIRGDFSPNFDNTNTLTKRIFSLYTDINNRFSLAKNTNGSFSFVKSKVGVGASITSSLNTFSKNQSYKYLVGQNASGMFMYLLKNNGTVEKVTNADTNLLYGSIPLHLLNQNGADQSDMFAESFQLYDLESLGRSSTKNLFKGNFISGQVGYGGIGNPYSYTASTYRLTLPVSDLIPVKQNTIYILTVPSGFNGVLQEFDIDKKASKTADDGWGTTGVNRVLTTGSNTYYLNIYFRKGNGTNIVPSDLNRLVQLEENPSGVATTYEPYSRAVGFTDYEAESILRGTSGNILGITNKELFDINAVTLHANATMSNGVITLNATGAWQQSYVYTDVLPNNKYELNYTSTNGGYMVVEEYYNGVFIKNGTTVAGTFVTSPTTNKVKVRTSNGSTGVFTWTNISFKLKM